MTSKTKEGVLSSDLPNEQRCVCDANPGHNQKFRMIVTKLPSRLVVAGALLAGLGGCTDNLTVFLNGGNFLHPVRR